MNAFVDDDSEAVFYLDWDSWSTITVYNAYENFIIALVNDKEELAIFSDDYGQTLTKCIKIENLEEWIIKNIILNHEPSEKQRKL